MRLGVAAVAICLAVVGVSAAQNAAAAMNRKPTNIPAQPVSSALETLAKERDLQVIYRSDVVQSVQSAGAVGVFTPDEALTRLLAGTGLTYRYLNDTTVTITLASSSSPNPGASGAASSQQSSVLPPTSSSHKEPANRGAFLLAQATLGQPASSPSVESQQKLTEPPEVPIQEVIVTAEKRSERLQDLPLSIAAFSGVDLARSGVVDSRDLPMMVPGLTIANGGSVTNVALRGISTQLNGGISTDPSTAIYVDGVYQPRFESALFDLLDVKDVEVLKGPQVVLYGRNAAAGSILINSNQPRDQFGGTVDVEFGNYSMVRATAALDLPLSDRALFRIAVASDEDQGYTTNILDATDRPGRTDIQSERATLKLLPTDDFDVIVRVYNVQRGGSGDPYKALNPAALGSIYNLTSPREVSSNQIASVPIHDDGANMTVDWKFGVGTLVSITAYGHTGVGPLNYDADSTEVPIYSVGVPGQPNLGLRQDSTFKSEELYLSGQAAALDWLVGAVYSHEDDSYGGADQIGTTNYFFPASDLAKAYAGYAQVGYALTQQLKVTAGVRYSDESKDVGRTFGGPNPAPFQYSEKSWNAVTPSFSVSYHINDSDMLYATFAKGFKSGGFNQFDLSPALNPEQVKSYEIGAKTDWLQHKLVVDMDLYKFDYTDLQVQVFVPPVGFFYENAATADGKGVEITARALPTEHLQIDTSIALQQARFDNFATEVSGMPVNYSGNTLQKSPKSSVSLGAAYSVPLPTGSTATLRGDYYYASRQFFSNDNNLALSQGGYSLLNARLTFKPATSSWEFGAFGKNLTNRVIYSSGFSLGTPIMTVEAPRTYGVEAKYTF